MRVYYSEIGFVILWNLRKLDLGENEVEDLSVHWLSHFPDSCTSLVSLNIVCLASEVSFSDLERLVARSPHLRTLRLTVLDYVEDSGLEEIANSCKELQEIRVFPFDPFAPGPNVSLTEQDRVFEYIGVHAKKLEMLSLAFAGDSDLGLHYVLYGCESLHKLEIRDCPLATRLCWPMLQSWRQCDPFGCPTVRTVSGRKFNTPGFIWIIAEDASSTPYSN
ncbi:Protein TRANSPORT INHIBITOR RESPONSE 1 [Capsicum baccatum]|uniref:Protein TRANSPORT INHIBITOR RESPONSE 1 n=1 Tax=Capsicum baccatum TaxID=33114 RepID=A0A2G2WGU1_CAPBA|nr:Protein TRANSPORT INHIBITOR RESPONSE 1 [Capsicum baccatum]